MGQLIIWGPIWILATILCLAFNAAVAKGMLASPAKFTRRKEELNSRIREAIATVSLQERQGLFSTNVEHDGDDQYCIVVGYAGVSYFCVKLNPDGSSSIRIFTERKERWYVPEAFENMLALMRSTIWHFASDY